MAYLIYCLFAFISAILSASFAEVISLRSPSRSHALAEHGPTTPHSFASSSSDRSSSISEMDLMDIVLVASVDGKFHALNRTSGQPLWSMSPFTTSTDIPSPSILDPLVRTAHVDHDPDLIDEDSPQELYVIEPQSGDIYVMATPTSPLQRFPLSMAELVDMSPFSFAGTDDGRVFVGRKETSLLLIELETGKIKATLNSERAWDEDEGEGDKIDLDKLEDIKPPVSASTEVYIGRTDYYISILPINKKFASRVPAQNLSFSVYGPNNKDNILQRSYRRTKDNTYIQSLPNGDIVSIKARNREDPYAPGDLPYLWFRHFNSPIVAIFDIMGRSHSHSHHNALALLQPLPVLSDVLPNFTPGTRLPNHLSAFVGMVKETGSLFALSPARFPLVAFGGPEIFTEGFHIDATKFSDMDDMSSEVDAVTRVRKTKQMQDARAAELEKCTGSALYTNRQCLIGVRPLEEGDGPESRLKRLLDGPRDVGLTLPLGSTEELEMAPPVNDAATVIDSTTNNAEQSPTIGYSTDIGWLMTLRGNSVESLIPTLILGLVSLWLGIRRFKASKNVRGETQISQTSSTSDASPINSLTTEGDNAPLNLATPFSSTTESPKVANPAPVLPTEPLTSNEQNLKTAATELNLGEAVVEDSDNEVEANEDSPAVPGKRKYRRGKRGKKKKSVAAVPELVLEAVDQNTPAANGVAERTPYGSEIPATSSLVITPLKSAPATPSLVVSDIILGFGSHGTVVFRGSLQGRAVAVKRLLQDFVTLASREVSILQESDDHPNVIRYYYQEAQGNFLYIALELCPASLADVVENPDRDQWRDIAIAFDPKKALKQITSGLRHIHSLKLVHRDIKPQNILISAAKPVTRGKPAYRMLISDFGLTKKLDVDQSSFLPTAHGAMGAGTVGWRAPEILRDEVKLDDLSDDHSTSSRGSTGTVTGTPNTSRQRLTKSVDIFALGCLFYYTMTNGGHPFGERFEREVNILKNEKNLDALQRFGEEGAEAVDLITQMLDPEAYERPDAMTCLLHPFFWDPARRLNFLQDASDRFEIMCRDPRDPYLLVLEEDALAIVGSDWHNRLDKIFIESLGKFRKYDGRSVQDLLRALRNKKHHYQDLPDNVKRHLGPMPEGFLAYFTKRFPRMFLHVHSVVGSTGLRTESMFRVYFELSD